ncbi:MAG: hypothetical protein H0U56_15520 [Methylibium sp.]|nr:hypothetical protein [Methylibium sp.]
MIPQALLVALGLLALYGEDKTAEGKAEQLVSIAAAVHEAAAAQKSWPGTKRELELLLLTIGHAESGFSMRIGAGEFRRWESDPGRDGVARAHSFWQIHKAAASSEEAWLAAKTDVRVAAREAARALTRARYVCRGTTGDWLTETLRGYAGSGCRRSFKGEQARVATFRRLERGK